MTRSGPSPRTRYDDSVDIRQAIYDIRQANGLKQAVLHPGDTLMLPYEGE